MSLCRLQLSASLAALITVSIWSTSLGAEPEVTKIWDKARNAAFTDLARWQDKFYCVFREGERHVHGADGTIRLIRSEDGTTWESVAQWEEEGIDLRDPKLSVMPDGRLMILMGGSKYVDRQLKGRLTRVAFLEPGQTEAKPSVPVEIDERIKSNDDWLWRVVWHKGVGYGCFYQDPKTERHYGLHLLKTTDGIRYELVKSFELPDYASEATALFLPDDRIVMVARLRETMAFGTSSPPYTEWEWKQFPHPLGGPDLELLPGGKIVMGTRAFDDAERKQAYMVLGTLALDGEFTEQVRLPSGGDTSYAGMVVHDGKLWVSYYSSHEGKTSVYLAKVPLEAFGE